MMNFGVIGAGYWGEKLVGEYLRLSDARDDVRLTRVADSSEQRLAYIREKFSLPSSAMSTDYREVLADPTVVGVHVATPNTTHFEIAMNALEKGKNVLLEKPMSLNSSDAFKLARFSEKAGRVLLVGHIFRFNNAVDRISELVRGQSVRYLELKWVDLRAPTQERDIVFDLAPHPVDILDRLLGERPNKVFAKAKSYESKKEGLEDFAVATLDFPGGVVAQILLSWIDQAPRERTIHIVGTENTIHSDVVAQKVTVFSKGKAEDLGVVPNNTIEAEITHFAQCVLRNDPPVNSALTGISNVMVLEAMRKSLTRDVEVPI